MTARPIILHQVDARAIAEEQLRRYHEGVDRDRRADLERRRLEQLEALRKRLRPETMHQASCADHCELCYTEGWRWFTNGADSYTGPWHGFPLRILWEPPPDYGLRGLSPKGRQIWLHARKQNIERNHTGEKS